MGNCVATPSAAAVAAAASRTAAAARGSSSDTPQSELLYTKPSGLYPTCSWDQKHVQRLILRGELAPRYPGLDDATASAREECPICMLLYPVLNQTRCCAARLCTECYLQIRPPRHNKEACPFCKRRRVEACFVGPRDAAEVEREERDRIRSLDAVKRMAEEQAASAAVATAAADGESGRSDAAAPSSASAASRDEHVRALAAAGAATAGSASAATVATVAAGGIHDVPSELTPPPLVVTPAASATTSAATRSGARRHARCVCHPTERVCPHDPCTRFFDVQSAPALDPLLLEAMASVVALPPSLASASGSASSSGAGGAGPSRLGGAAAEAVADADGLEYVAELQEVIRRSLVDK